VCICCVASLSVFLRVVVSDSVSLVWHLSLCFSSCHLPLFHTSLVGRSRTTRLTRFRGPSASISRSSAIITRAGPLPPGAAVAAARALVLADTASNAADTRNRTGNKDKRCKNEPVCEKPTLRIHRESR